MVTPPPGYFTLVWITSSYVEYFLDQISDRIYFYIWLVNLLNCFLWRPFCVDRYILLNFCMFSQCIVRNLSGNLFYISIIYFIYAFFYCSSFNCSLSFTKLWFILYSYLLSLTDFWYNTITMIHRKIIVLTCQEHLCKRHCYLNSLYFFYWNFYD